MTTNDLLDAIGELDPTPKKRPVRLFRKRFLMPAAAAILAACVMLTTIVWPRQAPIAPAPQVSLDDGQTSPNVVPMGFAVAAAEYPEMPPHPTDGMSMDAYNAYFEARKAFDKAYYEKDPSLLPFADVTAQAILAEQDGQNKLYSPISLYMALAMLCETTGGDSRQQILDLLGTDSIEQLRKDANAVWKAHYTDDGIGKTLLANSLWLNEDISFEQATLKQIAETYYASSFSGKMGSSEFNDALHTWMNEQTGGLLENQIDRLEMTPLTVLNMVSTVWLEARWETTFSKKKTTTDTFYGAMGEQEATFMNRKCFATEYYYGERFSAIRLNFEGEMMGGMWIVLPNEGVTPEALIGDEQVNACLYDAEYPDKMYANVNLSLPKFDTEYQEDLCSTLKTLGVTDVFDETKADFSPLDGENPIGNTAVSSVIHGARVMIDEEGCKAAAYTAITRDGTVGISTEEIDMIVDRPFMFVIESDVNTPLFIGVVNTV